MRRTILLTSAVLTFVLARPAASTDEFYVTRLQEGRDALRAGNVVEAVELLQVSCFGLLSRPTLYAEGLAWLAIAQSKTEHDADVLATLRRFVELESRFPSYAKADLPPAARADFERLLVKRIPVERLTAIPSLASLIETDEQKLGKMPPAARVKTLETKVKAFPKEIAWPLMLARTFAETKEHAKAASWAGRVLDLDAKNVEARVIRARARLERHECVEALADLDGLPAGSVHEDEAMQGDRFVCLVATKRWSAAREVAGTLSGAQHERREIAAALKKIPAEATAVVEAPPPVPTATPPPAPPAWKESRDEVIAAARKLIGEGKSAEAKPMVASLVKSGDTSREVRSLLLEAACLSKDWQTAREQSNQLQPFVKGEERYAFYSAVTLFESGSLRPAQAMMKQAQGKLARSPYVDYYVNRILGSR